jgi:hypothetical protein
MKRVGLLMMLAIVVLGITLTSCIKNDDDLLFTTIVISNRYKDATFHNGDTLLFEYSSDRNTSAKINIESRETGETLQQETIALKRGDGVMEVMLDVGDYVGSCRFNISYDEYVEDKFLSHSSRGVSKTFIIHIVGD